MVRVLAQIKNFALNTWSDAAVLNSLQNPKLIGAAPAAKGHAAGSPASHYYKILTAIGGLDKNSVIDDLIGLLYIDYLRRKLLHAISFLPNYLDLSFYSLRGEFIADMKKLAGSFSPNRLGDVGDLDMNSFGDDLRKSIKNNVYGRLNSRELDQVITGVETKVKIILAEVFQRDIKEWDEELQTHYAATDPRIMEMRKRIESSGFRRRLADVMQRVLPGDEYFALYKKVFMNPA